MDCASKINEPKITSRRNNPWPVKARDDPVLLFDATIPWHIFHPPRFLFKKFLKDLVDQEHLGLVLTQAGYNGCQVSQIKLTIQ